jgi:hypothetical protein
MSAAHHDTITGLQNFISEVKNKGLMRNTHFGVLIHTPTNANGEVVIKDEIAFADAMKRYIMFCDSAPLPGTSLSTVDVSPYGEIREQPTQRIYDPVNLTFYVDVDFKIKKFFDLWLNYIINPITRNHAYYSDYTTTVDIYVYDVEHNEKYKVTLHECYPKSVGEISMSYSSEGVMKLNVTLQYRNYSVFDYTKQNTIETSKGTTIDTVLSTGNVSLSSLAKNVAKQQTISDIMKESTIQALEQPILLLGLQ